MTVDEIKDNMTMFDVISRYGIKANNSDMCSCPFHGKDRHPSMKIYKDGYKCFTCGKAGDLFTFVQDYENCSFKDAFLVLGGTYESETEQRRNMLNLKFERQKNERIKRVEMQDQIRTELLTAMKTCELIQKYYVPFSESWCYAVNSLTYLYCVWEEKFINGREVNEIDVHRKCREVGCKLGY